MALKPKSADMQAGPGFRIHALIDRPEHALVEQYREFETPDVSDMLNRMYTMCAELHNLIDHSAFVGPACTVKVYPGDNLMVHKALDIARPGDVIVVDAGGHRANAIIGDLVAQKARHRGIQAFIIDGLVRDLPACVEVGLPIFARGVTPIGPLHRGPGEINYPVSCGGIVVNPGDIICADDNGVVVVRQDFAEEILARLYAQRESQQRYVADVYRGEFSNEWVDRILGASGCAIADD